MFLLKEMQVIQTKIKIKIKKKGLHLAQLEDETENLIYTYVNTYVNLHLTRKQLTKIPPLTVCVLQGEGGVRRNLF